MRTSLAWSLRLLDGLRLSGPEGEAVVGARKAFALLAYLALQPGRSASRDALAGLLWEHADNVQARVSLRQALAVLRKVEGEHPPFVTADGDAVRLTEAIDTDVRRFEDLAGGGPAERVQAAALYRTDLLAGFSLRDAPAFNEWLAIEQARLRHVAVATLASLADEALAPGGDPAAGVAAALRLLALDGFNEAGHRSLMRLYARQGRAATALQHYQRFAETLRRELQVSPEPRTRDLYETLKAGRASRTTPAEAAPVEAVEAVSEVAPETAPQPVAVVAPPAAVRSRRRMALAIIGAFAIAGLATTTATVLLSRPRPPQIARLAPVVDGPGLEFRPALSPDGSQVVFAATENGNIDLYLASTRGDGQRLRLTEDPASDSYPVWSPDGQQIAFVREPRDGASRCEIWVRPMPTGVERRVARCAATLSTRLAWTGDGKALVFNDSAAADAPLSLHKLELATGLVTQLTHPPDGVIGDSDPALSHDGRKLVFLRLKAWRIMQLATLDLASGREHVLSVPPATIRSAAWSHDDRGLIFSMERQDESGLWWVDAKGRRPPQRLSAGLRDYRILSYAHASDRMAFEAMSERIHFERLGRNARPTDKPEPLPDHGAVGGFASESARGDIVFVSARGGSEQLWLAEPGRAPQPLTQGEGWLYQNPALSPDGARIAYEGVYQGRSDIYVRPARGGPPVRLTEAADQDVDAASWSPDGRFVYYAARRDNVWRIWRRDAAGGAALAVSGPGGVRAVVSPDGKALYYVLFDKMGIRRRALGPDGAAVGPETMVVKDLTPFETFNWFVASDAVFYVRRGAVRNGGMIRRHDLATGEEHDVTGARDLLWIASFALGRDGSLLLVRRDVQLDISIIDFD